jgi:hypothetical protein
MLRPILIATVAFLLTVPAFADDLLPPATPIPDAIDHYIDAKLTEAKVTPAPQADDAALIRRLTLDLAGRIPTTAETEEFVSSQSPSKRSLLVDRLMASSGFIRHQSTMFDAMLMEGTKGSIREYLLAAMADNKSWDKIFSDLLMPVENSPTDPAKGKRGGMTGGANVFLRERLADLDKLTTEVSIVFFGVNVSCARCHDHPIVPDWKQDHFFGMKSFFARTVDVAGFLGEREAGLVKFQTTKGVSKQAKLMFLTGQVIEAPGMKELTKDEEKKEKELIEQAKKNKTAPPPPKFSARRQLVDVALQPQGREFFAKAIVNRLWVRMHGFGLVNPVDQMHSENPPSHPELMEWLARDTIEHGYDLRRLIRGLAMSKTYSRSSRWDGSGEPPMPKLFAVGRLKALTPMQMATSLRIATTDPKQFAAAKPDEFDKKMEGFENAARGMASMFEWPGEDFQVSVSEALLFSNGDRIQRELLTDGGDRLLGRMKQAKDRKEVIDIAVRTTLCRPPTADEIKTLEEYLAKRQDRPAEAQRQLVWALLNSSEFRFNY